jgi:hypothetical protein
LTEEGQEDPFGAISKIQSQLAFGPTCEALLQFLSIFGVSRTDACVNVFQSLKDDLTSKIQTMDDQQLAAFLKETIRFITFKDLRSIPLAILRKMSRIPPQYLKILVEKNLILVAVNNYYFFFSDFLFSFSRNSPIQFVDKPGK